MVVSVLSAGCGLRPAPDFTLIDNYLRTWDQFAQGDNSLAPRIEEDRVLFEQHLADALTQNDHRAPGRLVFYAVVQVGGFIPVSSPVGRAFQQRFGDTVPAVPNPKDGSHGFFAGDLYFWWEAHKAEHASFPLYEEWRQREFARNVPIRLYESAAQNRK
jgi:hypothetical protein